MTAIKRTFFLYSRFIDDIYIKSYDDQLIDETKNPKKKDMLKQKVEELMGRAEQIKTFLKEKSEIEKGDADTSNGGSPAGGSVSKAK